MTTGPYSLDKKAKAEALLASLNQAHQHHYDNSSDYRAMLDKLPFPEKFNKLEDYPYLPVGLYKYLDLKSVPEEEIFKTLKSSGTTSQMVSKIYLDRETAKKQSHTLVHIVNDWIGKQRLPMLIIDHKNILKNRQAFSARGAGIVGFSQFGRNHFYLLDDDMNADWSGLEEFLAKHEGEDILIFGFTFMIWQYFYQAAQKDKMKINLDNGILIHGGGWKKLLDQAVDNEAFRQALDDEFGIKRVHNYYGMVEQVGSIFMECEEGHLHTPDYADVIIRDSRNLKPLDFGQEGIIQVISTLPESYPGNSILTEDLGISLGVDDCACGRLGQYFKVIGRIPAAELRGCSDTFAYGSEGE